jgi:hypothetical protein
MRAPLRRLSLAAIALFVVACASDSPTAPPVTAQTRIQQAPTSPRGDEALSPSDSALCRSGFTLPGGRSCGG